jgi:hypothetical protein
MSFIAPSEPRATIADDLDGLRITIPARRNWATVVFLGVWLCFWGIGELLPLALLAFGQKIRLEGVAAIAFLVGWLVLWTIFGLLAFFSLLWTLLGREILVVDGHAETISIQHRAGPFRRSRTFDLGTVRHLRVAPFPRDHWRNDPNVRRLGDYPGFSGGLIAFDSEGRTLRFGGGIDESEAVQLVRMLKQRFHIPDDHA